MNKHKVVSQKMVIPLKFENYNYEPSLIAEYLLESQKHPTHLVEHLSRGCHPNNPIDKSINLVTLRYQLNSREFELASHPLLDAPHHHNNS